MSFSETVFLFILALIIFGPKKLPEMARQVGKYMNEFRRASNEFKAQIEQEISNLEVENRQTILPPSAAPEGVASRSLHGTPSEIAAADVSASGVAASEAPMIQAPANEAPASEIPPTQAASDDEPLFAAGGGEGPQHTPQAVTDAASPSNVPTPARSQESHV